MASHSSHMLALYTFTRVLLRHDAGYEERKS